MNLESIARRCGVSRSTVSRVINNSPNVRPEVRERVLHVLRETNFQPNMAARSLAAGSTHILGLVVPLQVRQLFVDPFFPLIIQGASAACNARDYSIMLWVDQPEHERRLIRQILHSGLIDGVIISSIQVTDPLIDSFLERNFPFVVIGRLPSRDRIHYIDVDNVSSACGAVSHLIANGRKRIAIITGLPRVIVTQDRLEGYHQAMQAAGLPIQPEWIADGDFTIESGYQAMCRLLPHRPDAVFATSDAMAQGAARAITEAGLTIPGDVAMVGFDDMPFASLMNPRLTTVRQPIEQMAQAAVDLLIDILNNPPDEPRHVILPTQLIIRESCGSKPEETFTI